LPEFARVNLDSVRIDPENVATRNYRIDHQGTRERLPEAAQGSLEIIHPIFAGAAGPEHTDQFVAVHPLVAGNQKIAEKMARLLAFPDYGDWRSVMVKGQTAKGADKQFFLNLGIFHALVYLLLL
jgi:hypothetical protein